MFIILVSFLRSNFVFSSEVHRVPGPNVNMNKEYYQKAVNDHFEFTIGAGRAIDLGAIADNGNRLKLINAEVRRFGFVIHGFNDASTLKGYTGHGAKYNIHGIGKYPLFAFNLQLI